MNQWLVGWLSVHGEIEVPNGTSLNIYFTTVLEALEASYDYYSKHGEQYQHAATTITLGTVERNDGDGSQTMEFI